MRKRKNLKRAAAVFMAVSVTMNLASLTALADEPYDTVNDSGSDNNSSETSNNEASGEDTSDNTTSDNTTSGDTSSSSGEAADNGAAEGENSAGEQTKEDNSGTDTAGETAGDGSTIISQTSESETLEADLTDVTPNQEVTLNLTPGTNGEPTVVTEEVAVALEDVLNSNFEVPEELKNGALSVTRPYKDDSGKTIGTEVITPVYASDGTTVTGYNIVRTTESKQQVTKNSTEEVTVEEAPEGYTVGTVTNDVTDENGNVIGSSTVTTENIYGSDGTTVIGYQITTTTTTTLPASDAVDTQSLTTIELPERPEEKSYTLPDTGDVITVTVEDLTDVNGDVIGYKKTTVLTSSDGTEKSRSSESIYGTAVTVTTGSAPEDNPSMIEKTVTEVKTVLGPTTTSVMPIDDWQEIEIETITISESETYQLVDTDEGTFFVYKGQMWPVIAQSGHGQLSGNSLVPNFNGLLPETANTTNKDSMLTNTGTITVSPETGSYAFWHTGATVQSSVILNVSFYNGNGGYAFPAQIELSDADGNKFYVLCADFYTNSHKGTGYNMANVETAEYYSEDGAASHIKAIALNGYWGTEDGLGSLDSVKQVLLDNTDLAPELIDQLTPGEALAATQAAIWYYGNSRPDYYTVNYDNIGTYLYDYLYNNTIYVSGTLTEDQKTLVSTLCTALINMDPASVTDNATTLITENNFASDAAIVIKGKTGKTDEKGNDTYDTSVSFSLEMYPSMFNDDLIVTVKDDSGNTIATRRLAGDDTASGYGYAASQTDENGNNIYTLHNLEIAEGVVITLNLSGTQYLNQGVYLYTADVYNKAQTFVGVAEGTRNVNLSVDLSFEVEKPSIAIAHTTDTTVSSKTEPYEGESKVYADIKITETDGSDGSSDTGSSGSSSSKGYTSTHDLSDGDVPLYNMLLEDLPMVPTALANAPHTGDHMALWLSLSLLSGLGLAVITISNGNAKVSKKV